MATWGCGWVWLEKRREKKRKFNEEVDRDIKLLIKHGYVKIDHKAKKTKYKEFEKKMKEWGFCE